MRFLPSVRTLLLGSCSEESALPPALFTDTRDDVIGQKKAQTEQISSHDSVDLRLQRDSTANISLIARS